MICLFHLIKYFFSKYFRNIDKHICLVDRADTHFVTMTNSCVSPVLLSLLYQRKK